LGPLLLLAPPDERLANGVERFVGAAAAALGRGTGSFDRF
jgi:hypothetical protein